MSLEARFPPSNLAKSRRTETVRKLSHQLWLSHAVNYVALDRRFVSWDAEEGSATARLSTSLLSFEEVDWPELRKHKRVVLLAEAGSGKSAELQEQARAVTAAREFGFYSQVKDVARTGLVESLGKTHQERLGARTLTGTAFRCLPSVIVRLCG